MIASAEACTEIEKSNLLFRDIKKNRTLSIFTTPSKTQVASAPVKLIPLREVKQHQIKRKHSKDVTDQLNVNKSRKIGGLRHSFFTNTATTEDKLKLFANQNGFIPCTPHPLRVSITVMWRSREITISTNNMGILNNIHHRKVRWLSTTFKQHSKSHADDVRAYLETRQELDEDENCLNTLIQYLGNRSTLNADLVKLINQDVADASQLPANPLIAEVLNLNWKFFVLRVIKSKLAFKNIDGDTLEFNEILHGVFDSMGTFEWFEKQNELEIDVNMTNRSNEILCRDSYDFSLKLFEFAKSKKEY